MKKNRNPYHRHLQQYGVIDQAALFVGSRRLARAANRGVGLAWRRRLDSTVIRALRDFPGATLVRPVSAETRQAAVVALRAEQRRIVEAMRAAHNRRASGTIYG